MHPNASPPSEREPDYVSPPERDPDRNTSGPGRLLLASVVVMAIGLAAVWWLLNRAG